MIKVAIMYDFDKTLCTRNMQEYELLPELGVEPDRFWGEVASLSRRENMESTLAYMYLLLQKSREKGFYVKRETFQALGKMIEYYPGVREYFKRITEYARNKGVEIQHFIISSGTKEILEGCDIYDEFERVYACEFHYDEKGNADWPAIAINYTSKTQFIFRINKNALELYEDKKVNAYLAPEKRDIPYSHMIYLGDGMTDVPCMRIVKDSGGYSICVYDDDKSTAEDLMIHGRVTFAKKADYREGSPLDLTIKAIIDRIVHEDELRQLQEEFYR
ncbi:MAG: haloacid dehalogenase-like hydrolase [Erysipelotrichaceae bacterium]|nr:haloacid dehalogenase-like hydrolase [Erysipelotrichaceae bacterium]